MLPREGSIVRFGGRPFVFRARPPRLEPMIPVGSPGIQQAGPILPPTPGKVLKPAPDFSDAATFSMPPVAGVRDVNEVY